MQMSKEEEFLANSEEAFRLQCSRLSIEPFKKRWQKKRLKDVLALSLEQSPLLADSNVLRVEASTSEPSSFLID